MKHEIGVELTDPAEKRMGSIATENPIAVRTNDLTPTWGEWGNIFWRFAECGETKALQQLRKDFARAMAACQAFKVIEGALVEDQRAMANAVFEEELVKQGIK